MAYVHPTTLVSNVGNSILKSNEEFCSPIPEHNITISMVCICDWKYLTAFCISSCREKRM